MLNRVSLVGRLGQDPELRYTQTGRPVCSFSIAVNRPVAADETGRRPVDWLNIVAWNQTALFVANYLGKGRLVSVDGHLQVRDYQDAQNNRRRVTEIIAQQVNALDRPPTANGQQTLRQPVQVQRAPVPVVGAPIPVVQQAVTTPVYQMELPIEHPVEEAPLDFHDPFIQEEIMVPA